MQGIHIFFERDPGKRTAIKSKVSIFIHSAITIQFFLEDKTARSFVRYMNRGSRQSFGASASCKKYLISSCSAPLIPLVSNLRAITEFASSSTYIFLIIQWKRPSTLDLDTPVMSSSLDYPIFYFQDKDVLKCFYKELYIHCPELTNRPVYKEHLALLHTHESRTGDHDRDNHFSGRARLRQ